MQLRSHPAHLALVVMFGIGTGLGAAQIRPAAKGKALPGSPCCSITAIDVTTKKVTAKVTATGETFTMTVTDRALLDRLKVGDTLEFKPDTTSSTSSAATAASPAGGTTTQGNNSPRTADTRPKDCIATTSSGAKIPVACPSNVPIKTSK